MPEPETNDAEQTKRRSQTKRELDALGEMIRVLKPLSVEQRERLIMTSKIMLGEDQP